MALTVLTLPDGARRWLLLNTVSRLGLWLPNKALAQVKMVPPSSVSSVVVSFFSQSSKPSFRPNKDRLLSVRSEVSLVLTSLDVVNGSYFSSLSHISISDLRKEY